MEWLILQVINLSSLLIIQFMLKKILILTTSLSKYCIFKTKFVFSSWAYIAQKYLGSETEEIYFRLAFQKRIEEFNMS